MAATTALNVSPPPEAQWEKRTYINDISDVSNVVEAYLKPNEIRKIHAAFRFGANEHNGQFRMTGEPYIAHPLTVAHILAEMHLDYQTIMAAILHDVIEDTAVTKAQISKKFGKEVSNLVDGVTKLTQIQFKDRAEIQADNFHKMILAMADDMRVILIKLADRLHNMRTISEMPPDTKRRKCKETLEIYAPIARRLGLNKIRLELESLALAAMYPRRYKALKTAVSKASGNHKTIGDKIHTAICHRLDQEGVKGEVSGREKHLFSLYNKMKNKRKNFSDVFDVYAFRIIVSEVDSCYRALGIMHGLYKPLPGCFKDYIAIPKANGYQSLHTSLCGPNGMPIEIQIRTEKMHQVAEKGIAAHWRYKTNDDSDANPAEIKARTWIKNLLQMQKEVGNSREFIENVKIDLFPDEVYVFTREGEIREFPRGATMIDFAYAIHSDVGHRCVSAYANRYSVPLSTPLHNGDTIEIITLRGARPDPMWLDFATTARARSSIRAYLKNLQKKEAVALGKRLLQRALSSFAASLKDIPPAQMQALLKERGLKSKTDLLQQIGFGNQPAFIIAQRLLSDAPQLKKICHLPVKGTGGTLINYARCCYPIPDDKIVGLTTADRGIVIHRHNCPNIVNHRYSRDRWVEVQWDRHNNNDFLAGIRVYVENKRGVLAAISAEIADMRSNIEDIRLGEAGGMIVTMDLQITVRNRKHLAAIMRRIRHFKLVKRIIRHKK